MSTFLFILCYTHNFVKTSLIFKIMTWLLMWPYNKKNRHILAKFRCYFSISFLAENLVPTQWNPLITGYFAIFLHIFLIKILFIPVNCITWKVNCNLEKQSRSLWSFLGRHSQSPRMRFFFAPQTPQSSFCFDSKVDRTFEMNENDAQE